MSAAEEKKKLRSLARRMTQELPAEYIAESDASIFRKLVSLPAYVNAKTVFAYVSVGREVSTAALLERAAADGKELALPRCGENGKMSFGRVRSADELCPGRFGIPEPGADAQELFPSEDDIIIVPALCCGRNGARLGHGAGYYDRYLEGCSAHTVCLCRKSLLMDEIPTDEHDAFMELVLTD